MAKLITFVFVVLTLAIISFGNPQWNKYIYQFQQNILLKKLDIPSYFYTGTWKIWDESGDLVAIESYIEGQLDGESKYLNSIDGVHAIYTFSKGEFRSLRRFDPNGSLKSTCTVLLDTGKVVKEDFQNGVLWLRSTWDLEMGPTKKYLSISYSGVKEFTPIPIGKEMREVYNSDGSLKSKGEFK